MLLHLSQVLTTDEVAQARLLLDDRSCWVDGRHTVGMQAVTQKNNHELAQTSKVTPRLQTLVLAALQRDPWFFSAVLPKRILPPLFNRYAGENNCCGPHVDGALQKIPSTEQWLRTDVSCTVFLSQPSEYDGGELLVQDADGGRGLKLAAGDAVLYSGTLVHQVTPVTRGERLAAFCWIESMVRSDEQRRMLFDLDVNLLKFRQQWGAVPETTILTGVYHNLLRQWADT